MHYPQHTKKYLLKSFFTPANFLAHVGIPLTPPETVILIYSRKVLAQVKKKITPKQIKSFYRKNDLVLCNNIGIMFVPGIGSPQTATLAEELISLGTKRIIIVGTAGGLIKEGIFVCTKAIRDEGTSHHYLEPSKYVLPDKKLTEEIKQILFRNNIFFNESTTWTIDTPYRETKSEIQKYASEGVATVEMEAAALFAVTKYRGIQSAAVFAISDVMGKKWTPKFTHKKHKSEIITIIKSLVVAYKTNKKLHLKKSVHLKRKTPLKE